MTGYSAFLRISNQSLAVLVGVDWQAGANFVHWLNDNSQILNAKWLVQVKSNTSMHQAIQILHKLKQLEPVRSPEYGEVILTTLLTFFFYKRMIITTKIIMFTTKIILLTNQVIFPYKVSSVKI